jgi:hypothetical protein
LVAAIAAATAGCSVVQGGAARPAAASYAIHCDRATCSLYLSKAQTREFNTNLNLAGGGVTGLAVACSLFALIGPDGMATVCEVGIAIGGSFFLNAASRAAQDNGCLRVQFLRLTFVPLAFYDDHSRYCHDT